LLNPYFSDDDIEDDNNIKAIDWSCKNMMAVTDWDRLNIYDNNGEKVSSYKANLFSEFNKITDVKWSEDGEYQYQFAARGKYYILHEQRLL